MPMLTCDDYCAELDANCKDVTTQQYADDATCKASCAGFAPGKLGDQGGATLGCRIYHGGAAKTDPMTHCPHAGPGGAGVCGSNCEGFCAIAMKACGNASPPPFTSEMDCMTQCMTFTDNVAYNASVTKGDSLACRLYHATAASVNPVMHCPHIVKMSAVCK
jgi:hypothetical protein